MDKEREEMKRGCGKRWGDRRQGEEVGERKEVYKEDMEREETERERGDRERMWKEVGRREGRASGADRAGRWK